MNDLLLKLKAISDKTRFDILNLLLTKDFCVKALANRLEISESAVSQQLKILRKADLVIGIKKGYFVHYAVKKENLMKVSEGIANLTKESEKTDIRCKKHQDN